MLLWLLFVDFRIVVQSLKIFGIGTCTSSRACLMALWITMGRQAFIQRQALGRSFETAPDWHALQHQYQLISKPGEPKLYKCMNPENVGYLDQVFDAKGHPVSSRSESRTKSQCEAQNAVQQLSITIERDRAESEQERETARLESEEDQTRGMITGRPMSIDLPFLQEHRPEWKPRCIALESDISLAPSRFLLTRLPLGTFNVFGVSSGQDTMPLCLVIVIKSSSFSRRQASGRNRLLMSQASYTANTSLW